MSDIINLKEYREKGEKEAESKNKEDSNNPDENKDFTTKVRQILDSGYRSIPDLDTIDIEFDFKENSLEILGAFFFKRDNQRERLKSRLTDQLDFVDSVTFRETFESDDEDFSEEAVNMYFQTEVGEVKLKNTRMEVDNS